MPFLEWGSRPDIAVLPHKVVSETKEIQKGNHAYVYTVAKDFRITPYEWSDLQNGDLGYIRSQIESSIEGAVCKYVGIFWNSDDYSGGWFYVKGFFITAYIENVQAGLTGLEIAAIVMAVGFIAALLTFVGLFTWVTWEVLTAAEEVGGGAGIIIVGLIILVLIGAILFFMTGGKVTTGKKGIKIKGRGAK